MAEVGGVIAERPIAASDRIGAGTAWAVSVLAGLAVLGMLARAPRFRISEASGESVGERIRLPQAAMCLAQATAGLPQATAGLPQATAFSPQQAAAVSAAPEAAKPAALSITWKDRMLTLRGRDLAGGEIVTNYLEAYCRAGSTDRDWSETVISHKAQLLSAEPSAAPRKIRLRDTLADGVTVEHTITCGDDEVDFQLVAHNPTQTDSAVHWAQPCVRLDRFIGADVAHSRDEQPPYIRNCFLLVGGKAVRLPTTPWATKARYTPGQVYAPAGVDRNDVNPRPLSAIVPSGGLCGAYSKDGKQIFAIAWAPYQEVFQGVITCMHSDFRIGGLKAGETKRIHGKMYVVAADMDKLLARYRKDFPEQAQAK
jgi:hypothetical protein